MTTTYTNTARPGLMKWVTTVSAILSITALISAIITFILSIKGTPSYKDITVSLILIQLFFLYSYLFGNIKLMSLTVDEENDLLTIGRLREKNIFTYKISEIDVIKKKHILKRYEILHLHDTGVRFTDFRTSKDNADRIIDHVRLLNPKINTE